MQITRLTQVAVHILTLGSLRHDQMQGRPKWLADSYCTVVRKRRRRQASLSQNIYIYNIKKRGVQRDTKRPEKNMQALRETAESRS